MKVIGIRPSSFTSEDKTEISGKKIYLTYPLEKGEGQGSEHIFVTDAKLNKWTYQPKVGNEVRNERRWPSIWLELNESICTNSADIAKTVEKPLKMW